MITENILYRGCAVQKPDDDTMLFIILIIMLVFAMSSFCSCMIMLQLSNKKGNNRVQSHTHSENQIIH